ncbi:MAG TPA: type II secretion system protein [Thermoanaerobaculia bacterium]|nr:type II secretion system protein [Thermoanaerobaculia bacterium]
MRRKTGDGRRKTRPASGDPRAPSTLYPLPSPEAGFTLLELLVVMTIIGILAAVAVPALRDSPQRAREAALRENLFTFRSTIDQFHGDKGYYPPDLQTLVSEGYLRQIPPDPMTKSRDTWVVDYEEIEAAAEGEATPEDTLTPGVVDVHSGSTGKALDGTLYKDW